LRPDHLAEGEIMLKPAEPIAGWRRNLAVAADAFLLSGAAGLLVLGALALLFDQPSVWSEVLSQLVLVGSAVGGTAGAWRLHGHPLTRARWSGVVLCVAAGAVVVLPAFFALLLLGRFIGSPIAEWEGPWGAVLVMSAVVIAFLALPVLDGVRDLAGRKGAPRVAGTRLCALAVVVAAVTITSLIGGGTAEVGIFMVPVSATSAAAIAALALFKGRRTRLRHPAT
jgi:hypothetical protein